jgi:hypothetical protein
MFQHSNEKENFRVIVPKISHLCLTRRFYMPSVRKSYNYHNYVISTQFKLSQCLDNKKIELNSLTNKFYLLSSYLKKVAMLYDSLNVLHVWKKLLQIL